MSGHVHPALPAGVEQPGVNEWAAPTLTTAGYAARPPPRPLSPAAAAAEEALQSCLLSLCAPSSKAYACSGVSELAARLKARGVEVSFLFAVQAAHCFAARASHRTPCYINSQFMHNFAFGWC
jgi:hypothetical protein